MKNIEISEQTYENFMKLKKAIEEMAGESVNDDQVIDFMIRSLMSSVELPDEEEDHDHGHCCGCCGHH